MTHIEFCPFHPLSPFRKGYFSPEKISKSSDLRSVVISFNGSQLMEPPSCFCLSSSISHRFMPVHILPCKKIVAFLLVEVQTYILTSQADFVGIQNDLIDIRLNSSDQMKRGPLLFRHPASLSTVMFRDPFTM